MSRSNNIRRAYLAIAALVAWLALIVQLHLAVEQGSVNGQAAYEAVVHYFSSFTILANIFAAVALSVAFVNGRETPHADVMAAIAVYMTIVFAIYIGEFRGALETSGMGLRAFTDAALHDILPVLFVLYWLIFVPKGSLGWRAPFVWLIFPLAYLAVSLVRGAMTGYYPYPWIDAAALGYQKVAINSLALLGVFLGVGFLFVLLDRALGRFSGPVDEGGPQA